MHRQPLLAMLDRYADRWPDERAVVERVRGLVASRGDCFERACRPGHVTASALVLSPDRSRVLLVHHRKLGRWLQPGGHADGVADPLRVALSEVAEETGVVDPTFPDPCWRETPLDLDVHPIPARHAPDGTLLEDAHDHHDIRFLLVAGPGAELRLSGESHNLGWFSPDEARALAPDESVLRLIRKATPWMSPCAPS